MSQQEEVDKLDFPFVSGPTMREVAELGEMILSDILYRDGLDQLPEIAKSLASIAGSLASIKHTLIQLEISR